MATQTETDFTWDEWEQMILALQNWQPQSPDGTDFKELIDKIKQHQGRIQ